MVMPLLHTLENVQGPVVYAGQGKQQSLSTFEFFSLHLVEQIRRQLLGTLPWQ